ncbi:MAG: hypothetical protein A4E63_00505 [Syntrophorhabdus sp. PtaU1.Bin050]|nr:MAG: hypothetical protein A4E63_00505 [Syntrophorhabdus sp. PtaU1.Bin050]
MLLFLLYLFNLLLFQEGSLYFTGRHKTLTYEDFAKLLLLSQGSRKVVSGNIAPLHEDFAKLLLVYVVTCKVFIHCVNNQLGLILYEDKDIPDSINGVVGGKNNVPRRIAHLRIIFLKGGNRIKLRHDTTGAKPAEFV